MSDWQSRSALENTEAALAAIAATEERLNAYVSVDKDGAVAAARGLDMASETPKRKLHGLPVAIKDNIAVEGLSHSAGTNLWIDRKAERDSPVSARLKAAGAVIVGKTTMPEFGHSATGVSHIWGPTYNPYDLSLSTGGSSSGSAASVACGAVPAALGTDGGGSVRIPASFCGVYGLKPSLGRVPYSPPSPTLVLAHIGPLTRTVRNAAVVMDAIKGPHPGEAASLPPEPKSYADALESAGQGLRVAYAPTLFGATVDPRVAASFEATIAALSDGLSPPMTKIEPDWVDPLDPFITLWISAQGLNVRDMYDGDLGRLDPGLKQIVERAQAEIGPESVTRAHWARAQFIQTVETLFEDYDILLTPTCACLPFPAEADSVGLGRGDSMAWAEMVRFTYPFNFTGHPAASIPGLPTPEGVPVGLQVIGPRFRDDRVLGFSRVIEKRVPWANRQPQVWADGA